MKSWSNIHHTRWKHGLECLRCALEGEALPRSVSTAATIPPLPAGKELTPPETARPPISSGTVEERRDQPAMADEASSVALPAVNVAEFFPAIPWQGSRTSPVDSPAEAPEKTVAEADQQVAAVTEPATSSAPAAIDQTLAVHAVFPAIPWQGNQTSPDDSPAEAPEKPVAEPDQQVAEGTEPATSSAPAAFVDTLAVHAVFPAIPWQGNRTSPDDSPAEAPENTVAEPDQKVAAVTEPATSSAPAAFDDTLAVHAVFPAIPWQGSRTSPTDSPAEAPEPSVAKAAPQVAKTQVSDPVPAFFQQIPWQGKSGANQFNTPEEISAPPAPKPPAAPKPAPPQATDSTPVSKPADLESPEQNRLPAANANDRTAPNSLMSRLRSFLKRGRTGPEKETATVDDASTDSATLSGKPAPTADHTFEEEAVTDPQLEQLRLKSKIPEDVAAMPTSAFFRSLSWQSPVDTGTRPTLNRISVLPGASNRNENTAPANHASDERNMLAAGLRSAVRTSERAQEAVASSNTIHSSELTKEFFQQIPWSNN